MKVRLFTSYHLHPTPFSFNEADPKILTGGVIFYKNRKGEAQMEGRFVPRKEDEVSDSGFEEGPAVLPQRPADD